MLRQLCTFQKLGTAQLRAELCLGPPYPSRNTELWSCHHCCLILGHFSHELNLDTSFLQRQPCLFQALAESWATSHKIACTYLSLWSFFTYPSQQQLQFESLFISFQPCTQDCLDCFRNRFSSLWKGMFLDYLAKLLQTFKEAAINVLPQLGI